MIKMILMYTAQPLAGANMLEQGAGELNIEGAVRLARLVRTDFNAATAVGSPPLPTITTPLAQSSIAGQTFVWGGGILFKYDFATGTDLIAKYQSIYKLGGLIGDAVTLSNGVVVS